MRKLGLFMLGVALLLSRPLSAADAPQKFALHPAPKSLPEIQFQDREGKTLTLTGFRGKLVLLNIWATWCLPCRHEMPTLDRLQAELGGPDFQVLALSMDRGGSEAITKFYGEVGVKHLAMYLDSSMQAASTLGAVGLPTTLLIDRDGREIGRLVGPAEWDSPDMVAFIRGYLAKQSGLGESAVRSANADLRSNQQLRKRHPHSRLPKEQSYDVPGAHHQPNLSVGQHCPSCPSVSYRPARSSLVRRDRAGRQRRFQLELARCGRHSAADRDRLALRCDVCPWAVR